MGYETCQSMFGLNQNNFSFDHIEFYNPTVSHPIRDIQKEFGNVNISNEKFGLMIKVRKSSVAFETKEVNTINNEESVELDKMRAEL